MNCITEYLEQHYVRSMVCVALEKETNRQHIADAVRLWLRVTPHEHFVCEHTSEWLFALASRDLVELVTDVAHEAGYLRTGEFGFRRYGTAQWDPTRVNTEGAYTP